MGILFILFVGVCSGEGMKYDAMIVEVCLKNQLLGYFESMEIIDLHVNRDTRSYPIFTIIQKILKIREDAEEMGFDDLVRKINENRFVDLYNREVIFEELG